MAVQFPNIYRLDISKGQPIIKQLPHMGQNDKYANRIGVELYNGSTPVTPGGSCIGEAVLLNGATVPMENGVVSGNLAYVDLLPACYAVPGPIRVTVKWTDGTTEATLFQGFGNVSLTETGTVIDPGTIIPSVSALIAAINEAKTSIPQDYSVLSANMNALTHFDLSISGHYIASTGVETANSDYSCTGYIPVDSDSVLILDGFWTGTGAYAYMFYTAAKEKISGANSITSRTVVTTIPGTAAYVRFSSRTSQGETPVAYVSNHVVEGMLTLSGRVDAAQELSANAMQGVAPVFAPTAAYSAGDHVWYLGVLYRFTADHAAGAWTGTDAVAAVVGAEVADLKSAFIAGFSGEQLLFISADTSMDDFSAGPIDSSGQPISQTNPASFHSGLRKIGEASHLKSTMALISDSPQYYHYINFYSGNNFSSYLSRVGGKEYVVNADVPDGALYYAVTLTYVKNNNIQSYSLEKYIVNAITVSPKNKWYVLGDSISAGYYSMTASMAQEAGVTLDYTSPVTTDQGETTGSVWDKTLAHNYWGYANQWLLRRQLVGKAFPGQGYYRKATAGSYNKNGVNVVQDNDFSDAGLITVAWGFNDWHYNMSRGNHDLIDASVPYPGENYDTTQITTVNQAIWYCLGELIRKAPNAKIVVQTPMNGWAYGGDWSTNWGIGYAMSNSGKLSDIHDDIVYWANYYGLQVLEMTYNNSIVNRRNIKDTIIDGSHPSDQAHQQLGRHVAIALKYC